jgi:hypothetical protein
MGNLFHKDPLVLDFNGLKTENMSSTIPYAKKYDADALTLVSRLHNTQNKSMVLFNESENYDMYKLFEKSPNINTNNDNNFSETSPFISSDVYKHLVSKNKTQKGGADDEDDESSTSSSSEDNKKKHKKDKKHKKEEEDDDLSVPDDEDDDELDEAESEENEFGESDMSTGSYLSSSAHTDGVDDSESDMVTTVSVKNHRSLRTMSDSVRTSDINIISVDE